MHPFHHILRSGGPAAAIFILSAAFLTADTASAAKTRRVPADYPTIQAAINACTDGDTVLIDDGTYTDAENRNLRMGGRRITVKSVNGPAACIIDAENAGRGFFLPDHEQADTLIEGLTIVNAKIGSDGYIGGGGICLYESEPTIRNCVIRGCTAINGGGILVYNAAPLIQNCVIEENSATGSTQSAGGGIYISGSGTIDRCLIRNNIAANTYFGGGGIYTYYRPTWVMNCIIVGNKATGSYGTGGGALLFVGSPGDGATFDNCTIAGNTAARGGPVAQYRDQLDQQYISSFRNCIWWGNTSAGYWAVYWDGHYNAVPIIEYSDIEGGWTLSGDHNRNQEPRFFDAINGDYHLANDSPLIDAGDPEFDTKDLPYDFDGQPRVQDGDGDGAAVVDIGADELGQSTRGDMDCDGVLNFNDIDPFVLALISEEDYRAAFPNCDYMLADINRDNSVNFDDIDGFVDCLINGACE